MAAAGHRCHKCTEEDPGNTRRARPIVNERRPFWCATHRKSEMIRRRKQRRARQVEATYDISAEDNHELLLFQGGRCWICQKATGATKSLAVDHDHATNEVRGRLCGPCNQFIGRQLGDDPEAAGRLVAYLSGDTPYRRLKACQAIVEEYPDHVPVVHQIQEVGDGTLMAFWTHNRTGKNHASQVRSADGTWAVVQ